MSLNKKFCLTPSRISKYKQCPQAYKFTYIDKISSPPTAATFRGTIVHRVLELLFAFPYKERTIEKAMSLRGQAIEDVKKENQLAFELLDKQTDEETKEMYTMVDDSIAAYFELEDPRKYEPSGLETKIFADLNENISMYGIADRIDTAPNGMVRIIDYKTSKKPAPNFSQDYIFQLNYYTILYEKRFGVRPQKNQLIFLGKPNGILENTATDLELEETITITINTYNQIQKDTTSSCFETKTGPLCNWCYFKEKGICPAFPKE